jgi:hypothetical protein
LSNTILSNRGTPCRHYNGYVRPEIVWTLVSLLRSYSAEAPKLLQKDGRYALMVDGRPYLILGVQIRNSSASFDERYGLCVLKKSRRLAG